MLLAPLHVGNGVVEVVEEDLPDPGAGFGLGRAIVGQPTVVGLDARVAMLVLVRARRRREQDEVREERWHRVGEDHLADDAVLVLLLVAELTIPVAHAQVGVLQVLERVLVLPPPGVEVVAVPRIQVLAILRMAPAGMAVGGDHDVVVIGLHGDRLPFARTRHQP